NAPAVFEQRTYHRPASGKITVVRDREDDTVRWKQIGIGDELDAIFANGVFAVGQGIVDLHRHAEGLKLPHDVDDLGVADVGNVFLEGKAEDDDPFRTRFAAHQFAQAFAGNALADAIVDLPAGQN